MKSQKKAQAALEYLLTYGWAILIVIIVGASLYALGIFSPGAWTGRRDTGFSTFRMEGFQFGRHGEVILVVSNQIGKQIELREVIVTSGGVECSIADGVGVEVYINGEQYPSPPNGGMTMGLTEESNPFRDFLPIDINTMYEIRMDCGDHYFEAAKALTVNGRENWRTYPEGSSFQLEVKFYYRDPSTGLFHTDAGTLFGQVEISTWELTQVR